MYTIIFSIAAALALTEAAHAAPGYLDQTDRLIVKYKDAASPAKGSARVATVSALRRASSTGSASRPARA